MANFTAKPIIILEENQYSNFEWIGETDDGCLLCRWDEEALINEGQDNRETSVDKEKCAEHSSCLAYVTQIAVSSPDLQTSQVLYTFDKIVPVVQATVNSSRTLLGFVVRNENKDEQRATKYSAFVAEIAPQKHVYSLNIDCQKQLMLEFLKTENSSKQSSRSGRIAKMLVFIHRESISIYSFALVKKENRWAMEDQPLTDTVTKSFVWAQWDPVNLHLYYLHHRPPPEVSLATDVEESNDGALPPPMLTALQFHMDKPHETVLNVPLELAGLEHFPMDFGSAGEWRDQGILHTLGDPWLDLRVVPSPSGAVCICHHYIYKSRSVETPADPESCPVYFAYSVTLLHHGCVLHSVIPEMGWARAHNALPTYSLISDNYLMVLVPGVCVHMLDIGLDHFPAAHILAPSPCSQLLPNSQLILITAGSTKMSSSRTLNFIDVANNLRVEAKITKEALFNLFKSTTSVETRLAILHMASVHDRDHDLSRKLIWSVCENWPASQAVALLKEYLVGETFAAVSKHMDTDASHLLSLLPVTTAAFKSDKEYHVSPTCKVNVSYCMLENACIMLLAPRERLVRGKSDTWSRLWDHTSVSRPENFALADVVDKLMVSLDTYKPEALSKGSTPISPATPLVGGLTISSLGLTLAHLMFDPLPFLETENTTSSKLEHLLSVNLRELSMFCLKHFAQESPMRVHAVASKYVCTQLQVSRRLCSIICSSQTVVPEKQNEKGFSFIDQLGENVAWSLFGLLEKYHVATEEVAFPLPQGFNSFFSFLSYRTLSHHVFMQYVRRGVLQLNVDVLRQIIYDLDDSEEGIERKLEIASCVPLVRCLRALQYWSHEESLLVRSRHHAASILAGEGPGQPKCRKFNNKNGSAPFPTADRISPFETFLDLLTAKANISDLDIQLLREGASASVNFGMQSLNLDE